MNLLSLMSWRKAVALPRRIVIELSGDSNEVLTFVSSHKPMLASMGFSPTFTEIIPPYSAKMCRFSTRQEPDFDLNGVSYE